MRKMILIDRRVGLSTAIVQHILKKVEVEITLLVVDNDKQKELFKSEKRIKQIVTCAEIEKFDSMCGIEYQIVRECKGAQLIVENGLNRFDSDYNDRKLIYYRALSFWNSFFSKNEIDLIFINDLIHGLPYDGLLKTYAKKYRIPLYSCNSIGVNKWACFIFDETEQKIVRVHNNTFIEDIMKYLKNDTIDVLNLDNDEEKFFEEGKGIYRKIKGYLKSKLYNIGGALLLDGCQKLYNGRLFDRYPIANTSIKTNIITEAKCYIDALKVKRFLLKHECEVDIKDKYVFYALQFEPEGNTQSRLTLEAQLVVIKMLSECIPEDWVVYVKEHPHQYAVNTFFFRYYINNINLFKTKQFYRRILSMKKVKLVKSSYSSQELVKNSKAVASLIGSILLETIMVKKPILLFSEYHPLAMYDEIYKCFSYRNCQAAILEIEKGGLPNYNDSLKLLNEFVCASLDDFVDNRIRVIANGLKREK